MRIFRLMVPNQKTETSFILFRFVLASYVFFNALSLLALSYSSSLVDIGLLIISFIWGFGFFLVWAPGLLFFLWMIKYVLQPDLVSSETALVGWLFLVTPLMHTRSIRPLLRSSAWVVLAGLYFNSGLSKLGDPGWQTGETIGIVLASGLNRWREWQIFDLNRDILLALSYSVIAIQLLAPVYIFGFWYRFFIWWSNVSFHIVTLLWLRVDQVSWAFLAFHLFIFEDQFVSVFAGPLFIKKQ